MLVEPAKFGIGLHQCLDIITLLVFKHDPTSSQWVAGAWNGHPQTIERMRTTTSHAPDAGTQEGKNVGMGAWFRS
jgi:hypothetical protein